MGTVTEHVDVAVPVRTAYDQWTQFEEFPRFMEGVSEVRQISDTMTHWTTEIGGVRREFDARITEQLPDERVAWRSTDGDVKQAGVVTFHRLDDSHARVTAQMEVEPHGVVEKAADALGVISHRVKGDLKRFKEFIESRGVETGAWRGEVPQSGSGNAPRSSFDDTPRPGYNDAPPSGFDGTPRPAYDDASIPGPGTRAPRPGPYQP